MYRGIVQSQVKLKWIKISWSLSFYQYKSFDHLNVKICFRPLILLEIISFEKIFKTVVQKFEIIQVQSFNFFHWSLERLVDSFLIPLQPPYWSHYRFESTKLNRVLLALLLLWTRSYPYNNTLSVTPRALQENRESLDLSVWKEAW